MHLLIVGSLEGHITAAGKIAMSRGAKVAHVLDIDAALRALRSGEGADLLMIDVKLDIARLIQGLKAERINVPVVACGIQSDAGAAVKAIKAGAKEYIPLPPNADLIAAVLEAVAQEASAVIHADPAMAQLLKLAEQIAPSDASVLITGESGTGKEVLAHFVHRKSRRSHARFVSVNCAAIPENLLESELFGHEKGAFTGAVARRIGKFEEASGGTLLLDEISEMDPRLQAKLLRAVQEREIDRVGGGQPVKIDLRLIATSNRDLEAEVRKGNFREDLFYRLNVVNLAIPALRQRPQDIRILSEHFARKYADLNGVAERPLSAEARAKLGSYGWRGNVRELENTIHRAVLIASGDEIGPEAIMLSQMTAATPDIATAVAQPADAEAARALGVVSLGGSASANVASGSKVGQTVAEMERHLIINTLTHCLGNRTHAANILGISIRTLRNKLKQYSDEGIAIVPPGEGERPAF